MIITSSILLNATKAVRAAKKCCDKEATRRRTLLEEFMEAEDTYLSDIEEIQRQQKGLIEKEKNSYGELIKIRKKFKEDKTDTHKSFYKAEQNLQQLKNLQIIHGFKKKFKGSNFKLKALREDGRFRDPMAIVILKKAPELGLLISLREHAGTKWIMHILGYRNVPLVCGCCLGDEDNQKYVVNNINKIAQEMRLEKVYVRKAETFIRAQDGCQILGGSCFSSEIGRFRSNDEVRKVLRGITIATFYRSLERIMHNQIQPPSHR